MFKGFLGREDIGKQVFSSRQKLTRGEIQNEKFLSDVVLLQKLKIVFFTAAGDLNFINLFHSFDGQ